MLHKQRFNLAVVQQQLYLIKCVLFILLGWSDCSTIQGFNQFKRLKSWISPALCFSIRRPSVSNKLFVREMVLGVYRILLHPVLGGSVNDKLCSLNIPQMRKSDNSIRKSKLWCVLEPLSYISLLNPKVGTCCLKSLWINHLVIAHNCWFILLICCFSPGTKCNATATQLCKIVPQSRTQNDLKWTQLILKAWGFIG